MNFKDIERATKLYEKIKAIDKQIADIEKFALKAANGELKTTLELKIFDLTAKKPAKEKKQNPFDELNELMNELRTHSNSPWGLMMGGGSTSSSADQEKPRETDRLAEDLTDTTTMQILGTLLAIKHDQRAALIREIERIGVTEK